MKTWILLPMLALGCATHAPPTSPRVEVPAAGLPVDGVLMLGDMHGTRELPAFVGAVVATVAARGPVVLGLEIPSSESPVIAAYLGSDGGAAARSALIAGAWWRMPYQDGRRSVAMVELIERTRQLRAAGAAIDVVAIDGAPDEDQEAREEGMAGAVIAARRAHPGAAMIVYAGNLHTSRASRPGFPQFDWMGMRVVRAGIPVVSLDPRFPEGTAWLCFDAVADHCGVSFVGGEPVTPGIHLERGGAVDGWYSVASATASPPAVRPVPDLAARIAAAAHQPRAMRGRAMREYQAKRYGACADLLAAIPEPDAGAAYDHACCLALAGRKDEAFERLRFAVSAGFTDLAHLAQDEDLASLHADPRWPVKP